jgi:hypothetical protein
MDRERARALIRRVFAVGFGAAALFHAAALAWPNVAEPSPAWRHALFVVINAAVALGFLFRPPGFALLFALLTAQQLWGHGTHALEVWRREHRVDWASVVVLLGMPLAVMLLLRDARGTRSMPPTTGARSGGTPSPGTRAARQDSSDPRTPL